MNNISKKETVYTRAFDTVSMSDCTSEIILPDYYPEIKKIVSVRAQALPDSKYISEGRLEYGGTVSFTVLYIGDDNSLCGVSDNCEYSSSYQLLCEVDGINAIGVRTFTEGTQCRVTAPRSLSLRTKLKTLLSADAIVYYSCKITDKKGEKVENLDNLEFLEIKENTSGRKFLTQTGSAAGELTAEENSKPVSCSGELGVSSVSVENERIKINGNINIQYITLAESGRYETKKGSIPFEETVEYEGAETGDSASASGRIASVSVMIEGAKAQISAEYDIDIVTVKSNEYNIVEDIYSTIGNVEEKRSVIDAQSSVSVFNGQLTVTNSFIKTNKGQSGYIITSCGEAFFDKIDVKGANIILAGSCKAYVYFANDGNITVEESTFPVKYEIPFSGEASPQELLYFAGATVIRCDAKDSGDKINITLELSVMTDIMKKYRINPITETIIGDEIINDNNGCVIKICCRNKGASIWETAKKHHAGISKIERINGISGKDSSDGEPLIIM